jgi:hypothetical protein
MIALSRGNYCAVQLDCWKEKALWRSGEFADMFRERAEALTLHLPKKLGCSWIHFAVHDWTLEVCGIHECRQVGVGITQYNCVEDELMDLIGSAGLVGTLCFGIVSLYQWTALKALRKGIRAHAQTTYNISWNIGTDNKNITERAMKAADTDDLRFIIGASRAADASSVSCRHAITSFAREYADFEPFYEVAWESKPPPAKAKNILRKVLSTLGGD